MDIKGLKDKILQLAIQGKLVEQDENDEPASVLLERIKEERDRLVKEKKIRKPKKLAAIEEEEKPFDIPDSWKWVRLGEIILVSSGKNLTKKNMITEGDIPVYGGNGIVGRHNDYNIDKPTIIIGRVGFYCGSIHLIAEKAWVTDNAFITEYSKENIYVYFLKYLLKGIDLRQNDNATAQPVISGGKIYPILVPLPPLAEQKRIVEKIDQLFALIDELDSNKEELLEVINLTRNQVLQKAMQGKLVKQNPEDEPASILLEKIKEERDRLVKEKKIRKPKKLEPIEDDEKPFDIPDSWEWVRFGNLVDFKIGKTPKRGQLDYWDNGIYPWFSISDIIDGQLIYDSKEKISEKAYIDVFKKNISPKGTLIMSFKLSIGKMSILGVDGCHNEAIISIFPICDSKEITKRYIFKIMDGLDILGDSKSAVKGATLNTTSLNNILIPLPPIAEQKRIVKKVDQLFSLIDELENQLNNTYQ